jgi:hypothetical protein
MARRDPTELVRAYEGAGRLGELLAVAGSTLAVEEVKACFAEALTTGAKPSDAFPSLFEGEPHFPSPQVAQQLYGNLFGLWDRIADGHPEEPALSAPRPERPAATRAVDPPKAIDRAPDGDFVEQAFRYLASLPERERRRWRDRFEQRESDLIQAIATLKLEPAAEEVGVDMGFELWLMAELALGTKVGRTDFGRLRSGGAAGANPAMEAYLSEWLSEAMLDEEDPLRPEERARLEPLLLAAIAQLVS